VGSTLFSTPIIAFLRHSGHQILRTCCRESARKRLTPQDRCCRLRLDAEGAALVDVGAVGGEAPDEMLGGKYGCHLAATLTRRSAMKVRHGVMGWTPPDGICVPR